MTASRGQEISAEVQDHLIKMGVDTQAWIHAMRTPSDQLYVFMPQELTEYKLAMQITRLARSLQIRIG